ncbi:Amino acid permease 6 [Cucurbita argyrosperma subsp. argyrosperma]|nr:Amino acid permease 6 [Cucurbita argyrosperma subsp. argyrosperma]
MATHQFPKNSMHLDQNPEAALGGFGKDFDDDGREKRTGTWVTASAHIITAVIGSGVLSLAWTIAQLGWVVGPAVLVAFSFITYFTSTMLADCYRAPDPVTGKRNYTYMDVVKAHLGGTKFKLCGLAQYGNLVGISIGYTITASISMVAVKKSNCYHKNGHQADCTVSGVPYMLLFSAMQVLLSQIPNFHKLSWLSILAAVMSFAYASIGVGLSIAKVASGENGQTSLTGIDVSGQEKVFRAFRAIGDIAFAYAYSTVLVEIQMCYHFDDVPTLLSLASFPRGQGLAQHVPVPIMLKAHNHTYYSAQDNVATNPKLAMNSQLNDLPMNLQDTLRSSPPENKAMKRATFVGISTTSLFYILCGCVGYAAFGNNAPGNFLTGFGFYEPFWLIDFANICIAVHLVGAYQVFCQPVYGFVEKWCSTRWPESKFITTEHIIKLPFNGEYPLSYFRLIWRTAYVIVTTVIAMIFPFFNAFLALLGATSFWPLTVYFPVEMYIARTKLPRFSFTWIWLKILSWACLVISLMAAAGSIQSLAHEVKKYKPFQVEI